MIARKTWREIRGMTIGYVLILEVLLVPAILLWPDLERGGTALAEIMPARFLRDMMRQALAAYPAYLAVQMFFKGVNIVGLAAAVLLGTGIVARERENQTLEFLLARPISRSHILWHKFWVTALAVVIPIFLTSWSAIPLSAVPRVDEEVSFAAVTLGAFHSATFVLAVLGATTVISVVSRLQVHTAFWIGGFLVLQAAVFFVQEIRAWSVFRLSDFEIYGPVMAGSLGLEQLFLAKTVWLLAFTALCYGIADRLFRRVAL